MKVIKKECEVIQFPITNTLSNDLHFRNLELKEMMKIIISLYDDRKYQKCIKNIFKNYQEFLPSLNECLDDLEDKNEKNFIESIVEGIKNEDLKRYIDDLEEEFEALKRN